MDKKLFVSLAIVIVLNWCAIDNSVFATTTLNLTGAGSTSGTQTADLGGNFIIYQQAVTGDTSFLRIQDNTYEGGYNSSTISSFDVVTSPASVTRALLLSDVPIVNIGGVDYREFVLFINQITSTQDPTLAYLSLNQVQIFLNNGDVSANDFDEPASAPLVLTLDAGTEMEIFRMSNSSDPFDVQLNYANPMYLFYIADSAFTGSYTNVILYAEFGSGAYLQSVGTYPSNDGYEQWSVRSVSTSVPEPSSLILMFFALSALGLQRLRSKRD